MNILKILSLAALAAAACTAGAEEEKKFSYDDFKYTICVGNGDYSKEIQERILKVIKDGYSINGQCINEGMFAAVVRRTGSPEFISELLKNGADPDLIGKNGMTALMVAVSSRKTEIAAPLLSGNFDPGARNKKGDTLLMMAFDNEDREIARRILQTVIPAGVVNEKGADGNSVLMRIAKGIISYDESVVQRLAALGADFNQISADGLPLIQESLLRKGTVRYDGKSFENYVKNGADINLANSSGENILHFMSHYHLNSYLIDYLFGLKPDINARDRYGNTPLLALFVNSDGKKEGDTRSYMQKLIKAGADVNAVNNDGMSVVIAFLIFCADHGLSIDLIDDLAKAGAKLDVRSPDGHGVLYYAAISKQRSSTAETLIKANPDINEKDPDTGMTVLMLSILAENYDFAEKIIKAGADVNIADREGRTPLMALAFHYPNESLAKKLLQAGADLNAVDKKGRRAFDYLEESFYADSEKKEEQISRLRKLFLEEQ